MVILLISETNGAYGVVQVIHSASLVTICRHNAMPFAIALLLITDALSQYLGIALRCI